MVGRWNVLAKWSLFTGHSSIFRGGIPLIPSGITCCWQVRRLMRRAKNSRGLRFSQKPVSQEVAVWMSRGSSINPSCWRTKYIVYSRNCFFWVRSYFWAFFLTSPNVALVGFPLRFSCICRLAGVRINCYVRPYYLPANAPGAPYPKPLKDLLHLYIGLACCLGLKDEIKAFKNKNKYDV